LLNHKWNQLLQLLALLESIQELLSHVSFTVLRLTEDDKVLECLSDHSQLSVYVWFCDCEHQASKNLAVIGHESLFYLVRLSMELNDDSVEQVAEKINK